ncbi:MAG: class I SAM-dependent methyltransferase [Aureliella sp.]
MILEGFVKSCLFWEQMIVSAGSGFQKWIDSADAWIVAQGIEGDWSRRAVVDPALESILENVRGRKVLDLGCGEGRYSRILNAKGAVVTGIDPVPKFIERARALDQDSNYVEGTAESLCFPDEYFDIVLSYLSFVDIEGLKDAASEIVRVLRRGGKLVIVSISNVASTSTGWVKDESGNKKHRVVDRYMDELAIELELKGVRVTNYHRPLSYTLGLFLGQGFVLSRFEEPLPDAADPKYDDERRVPTFQILCLDKATW